jgi:hypothetical protein
MMLEDRLLGLLVVVDGRMGWLQSLDSATICLGMVGLGKDSDSSREEGGSLVEDGLVDAHGRVSCC